jgi:DNA-directed RNA polymerase specialized sigma24 family protein
VPLHRLVREQGEVSEDHHRRDAFETHRHRIFALAVYMTGDERVAEDLLAETFIRVLRVNPSPDGNAVDLAFLVELRRLMPVGECTLTMSDVSTRSLTWHGNVLRTELEAALLDLPATERLIYLLRDVEAYSPARIAALLSLSEFQVKLALMAGRLKLRELLSERGEAQSAA